MSELHYKKVAIISAMDVELYYVDDFLKDREGWKRLGENSYENAEKGLQVLTRVLGVGKVNAAYQTADVIAEYQPDLIINVGYAGGLEQNARTGDVAIGTEYVQVDFIPYLDINRPQIADSPKRLVDLLEETARNLEIHAVAGKIATGDFFLHDTKQKEQIIAEYHPIAFDMESAAIAQVATGKNIDFVALRTFSDLADNDAGDSFTESHEVEKEQRIPIERRPITLALTSLESSF